MMRYFLLALFILAIPSLAFAQNQPPVADAGGDRTAYTGETVIVAGSATDPDPDPIVWWLWWLQGVPAGRDWTFTETSTPTPHFMANTPGDYVLVLVVRDARGAESALDYATIHVAENPPPVADAGRDRDWATGTPITLCGSATDPDGDWVSHWFWQVVEKPAGGTGILATPGSECTDFTAWHAPGDYVVSLIVTDERGHSSVPDYVTIHVVENLPPVAIVTADKTEGSAPLTVQFDGSQSYDPEGSPVRYYWRVAGFFMPWGGPGEAATLQYTYLDPGKYRAELMVLDPYNAAGHSDPLIITVTDPHIEPYGQSVYCDGSATVEGQLNATDEYGHPLTFALATPPENGSVVIQPDGEFVYTPNAWDGYDRFGFTASCGTYVSRQAIVKLDYMGSYDRPPVVDAGPDINAYSHDLVTLNGSAVDPEGFEVYSWTWEVVQKPSPDSRGGLYGPHNQNPQFLGYDQGDYVLSLTVWDGTSWFDDVDYVTVHVRDNLPPIAVATADKGGPTEDDWWIEGPAPLTVQFDGSGSYDPDPQGQPIVSYRWDFGDGSEPSFEATPPPHTYTVPGVYSVVILSVTDEMGYVGTDTMVIAVTEPVNQPPVADAGPDQLVTVTGSTVHLDGSQSYDSDGDSLMFAWVLLDKPAGSHAVLASSNTALPTFVADVYGAYVVQLVVSDNWASSAPDMVTISFDNLKPVANAGVSSSVDVGTAVTLDGSSSFDANGDPLTYAWMLASRPPGSSASIVNPTSVSPTFMPDTAGTYVVQLIVSDGLLASDPSTVQIQAVMTPSAAVTTVADLQAAIGTLPPVAFKNANMQNALNNKLNAVIGMIEGGDYASALEKLENDILGKTDGCANSGGSRPDSNDWIKSCGDQAVIYPLVLDAIAAVRDLM